MQQTENAHASPRPRRPLVAPDVRRESVGLLDAWGRTVWFGTPDQPRRRARYYYATRDAARGGDIVDQVGERGRLA